MHVSHIITHRRAQEYKHQVARRRWTPAWPTWGRTMLDLLAYGDRSRLERVALSWLCYLRETKVRVGVCIIKFWCARDSFLSCHLIWAPRPFCVRKGLGNILTQKCRARIPQFLNPAYYRIFTSRDGWKLVICDACRISISATWWCNHTSCHWGSYWNAKSIYTTMLLLDRKEIHSMDVARWVLDHLL